jgi:hypothetical protein
MLFNNKIKETTVQDIPIIIPMIKPLNLSEVPIKTIPTVTRIPIVKPHRKLSI